MTPSRTESRTCSTRGSAATRALKRTIAWSLASCGCEDLAAPQGVVGDDEAADGDQREDGVPVVDVAGLVGVDEDEVEAPALRRELSGELAMVSRAGPMRRVMRSARPDSAK
jgi:hypothetical protein